MRAFRCLALLLTLLAPAAFADSLYQVEVILFRQAGEPIPASQTAPDNWADGAQALAADSERGTALNAEAAKLTPANGYQVLLHQAWQQSVGEAPTKIALSSGKQQFGHFPVEGTLSLKQERFVDLESDFWINQFDADGLLTGSERLKQANRLKNGELTFLDHGSLGLLIKVSPL
ncbi:hypothetical protein D3879_10825 [Pseudomonas cavernicola]|uniref:Peptidoglycan-binding protein CsiV n=1 Tax=Pseudomonas cavernicola TaxID=2320866 RepID=A0A418XMN1_9PSED|nr:CsiV family protein [Pseudomonas cavernicola]RJG13696.1 hypothetical protein D3879_10825 [Pseudomonas cavernicola]